MSDIIIINTSGCGSALADSPVVNGIVSHSDHLGAIGAWQTDRMW